MSTSISKINSDQYWFSSINVSITILHETNYRNRMYSAIRASHVCRVYALLDSTSIGSIRDFKLVNQRSFITICCNTFTLCDIDKFAIKCCISCLSVIVQNICQ